MKIRKPDALGALRLLNDCGEYCAVGWLGHEAGIRDEAMKWRTRYVDIEDKGCEHEVNICTELGTRLGVDSYEIDLLMGRNDRANPKDRVDVFVEWCDEHGIELVESEHDQ